MKLDLNPHTLQITTPTRVIQCQSLAELMKTYSALMLASHPQPARSDRKATARREREQGGQRV